MGSNTGSLFEGKAVDSVRYCNISTKIPRTDIVVVRIIRSRKPCRVPVRELFEGTHKK